MNAYESVGKGQYFGTKSILLEFIVRAVSIDQL